MSAKHTPGPWTQHEGEVRAKNYGLISRSYYGKPDGEGVANARLIAAAPELLQALQGMVDYYGTASANIEALEAARAALAKAEIG